MGNKGLMSLSEPLQYWNHCLKVLDISYCHVSDKGLVPLVYALEKNYGMSLSIEVLNLSGNNLDKNGSQVFFHHKIYKIFIIV